MTQNLLRPLSLLLSCALVVGCTKQTSTVVPSTPAKVSAAALAVLGKADVVDGKTDKLVEKCAGCALGMSGKSEFGMPVEDYTMHFCSKHCLDRFSAAPEKEILAIKLPK